MSTVEIIKPGIVKPGLDQQLLRKLQQQAQEQSTVILHCMYHPTYLDNRIRIWASTFLIAHNSAHRSALLHAENIAMNPTWTILQPGKLFTFTLIFEALPKSCAVFDMLEDIPEEGAFFIPDIPRNNSDVYVVEIE